MYLTEPRLTDIVMKQVHYKFNAYTGVFTALMVMQIIGVLLAFNAGGGSYGSSSLEVSWTAASGDMPVILTLIWAFSMGVLLTTTAYRNDAFAFVSNRLSHHLSSFGFLLAVSGIGGVTAVFAGSIVKFISMFRSQPVLIESWGVLGAPMEYFTQLSTAILYTILLASFGYGIGSFIQRSKLVIPILIIFLFVLPFFAGIFAFGFIEKLVAFYGTETYFFTFLLKVVVTVIGIFGIAVYLTDKLEVRK
ncbi:hypothetical protein AB1K83_10090 [Sporosarcina sp. 179-K 3D1 HS]|uniref:hypothetical protein n=1 Tax=Sporosarcina sp. 179-K 3D1 HS TaxID=3232169 RepID=UPI00399F37BF